MKRGKYLCLALMLTPFVGLLAGAPAAHAGAPALAALLTHEHTEQGADGVTRISRYQERMVRSADAIWIERVLPASNDAGHASGSFNVLLAPRWIHAGADGTATLDLIDTAHDKIYSSAASDYERVGFSGRWAAQFSLIDPASLRGMQPGAATNGARWYEQRTAQDYMRVLWNSPLMLPLAIETGTRNGRFLSRTSITLLPMPVTAPWQQLRGYARAELGDLED